VNNDEGMYLCLSPVEKACKRIWDIQNVRKILYEESKAMIIRDNKDKEIKVVWYEIAKDDMIIYQERE